MVALNDALSGVDRLGLDTSPIIYFVEANPRYDAVVTQVFDRIAKATLRGITSTLTLTEVLVLPIQKGQPGLQMAYTDLLLKSTNFYLEPIGALIAARAARVRASYHLRTPDALQVATAMEQGCQAFLTNDRAFLRVSELRVLLLDDLTL
jgi:predicted nucleic acid-binding protein